MAPGQGHGRQNIDRLADRDADGPWATARRQGTPARAAAESLHRCGHHRPRGHVHQHAQRLRRGTRARQCRGLGSEYDNSGGHPHRSWRARDGDHQWRLHCGSRAPNRIAGSRQASGRGRYRWQGSRNRAGDRPDRYGGPRGRCLQRRHGHHRWQGPKARRQTRRQLRPGARAGREEPRLPDGPGGEEEAATRPMSVGSAVSTSRHMVKRGGESNFAVPPAFVDRSKGFRRWALVGEESPAVHTGFAMCTLEAGGWVAAHLHSYEESVYLLEGEAELTTTEGTFRLRAGDYGVIPVGVIHSWRGLPKGARWAQMMAPQPRARFGSDTYFPTSSTSDNPPPLGEGRVGAAIPIDVRDPRTRSFGHIEASNMEVSRQTQDQLAVSASMRTALLVYSGITVRMMVDSDLGAQLTTSFMVQYEPNGVAAQHDHPFEETYLIVER